MLGEIKKLLKIALKNTILNGWETSSFVSTFSEIWSAFGKFNISLNWEMKI